MIKSHKDLLVWQKSFALVVLIYKSTEAFPREEVYGLTSQIRRSAVSIPSNIAEGYNHGYKQEYIQFLRIAFASGAELETQLLLAKELKFLPEQEYVPLNEQLGEVLRMLNGLIGKLSRP